MPEDRKMDILAALSERANKRMLGATIAMALCLLAVCGISIIKHQ